MEQKRDDLDLSCRIVQFDVLRVIATIAVVLIHTSAQRFYYCFPSIEWNVRNIYDSSVRWAVPIFVMISGALFLNPDKKIETKTLYTKYIMRIILFFAFWSVVYGIFGGVRKKGLFDLFLRIVQGPYHFWFLKMIIGLYICVPILRPIVRNRKLERYFLCLSLVTAFFIPMLFPFLGLFSDFAGSFVEKFFDEFGIHIALGYVGYFVLGHYLTNNVFSEKTKKGICVLGIMSIVVVCVLTYYASKHVGAPYIFLYEFINMFTLFEAVSIFIVIKDRQISSKYLKYVNSVSKYSLGIYIIHPLVMLIVSYLCKLHSASLNPIYFLPLYTLLIFVLSYFSVFIMKRIPIIKKLI